MNKLFTEWSTVLVGSLVGVLLLMRIVLQYARPGSATARFIIWFWSPEARARWGSGLTGRGAPGTEDEDVHIHEDTLGNMNSTLAALAIVFFVIRPFVIQAFFIPSASMEPTLMGNPERQDRVLVNKYLYHVREPKRQEIIVFHAPKAALQGQPAPQDFIKRLIGKPGDTVEVRSHHAYINGKKLDEPYLDEDRIEEALSHFRFPGPSGDMANFGPIRVPPGKYFVLGDNRTNSFDSRGWGEEFDGQYQHKPFVDADQVLGKAMCVFWPIPAWKLLRTPGNN